MPLINCPECGNQVSDRAPTCPHCGVPIATQAIPAERAKVSPPSIEINRKDSIRKTKPFYKRTWAVIIGIIGIILLVLVAFILLVIIFVKPDEIYYNQGLRHLDDGKYIEAEKDFRETIRLKPGFSMAHLWLGYVLSAQGNYYEAEKEYRETIRLKPDIAEAHYELGKVLSAQKKYIEAESELREAIRMKPNLPEAQSELSKVLSGQEEINKEGEFQTPIGTMGQIPNVKLSKQQEQEIVNSWRVFIVNFQNTVGEQDGKSLSKMMAPDFSTEGLPLEDDLSKYDSFISYLDAHQEEWRNLQNESNKPVLPGSAIRQDNTFYRCVGYLYFVYKDGKWGWGGYIGD